MCNKPCDAGLQYPSGVFYLGLRFVPSIFSRSVLQTERMSLITHPAFSHLCNRFVPGIYFALQKAAPLLGPWLCLLKALLLSRIWNSQMSHAHVTRTHWLVVFSYSSALAHLLESPHVVTILLQTGTVDLESIISSTVYNRIHMLLYWPCALFVRVQKRFDHVPLVVSNNDDSFGFIHLRYPHLRFLLPPE